MEQTRLSAAAQAMSALKIGLRVLGLIEKDKNGDVLWTWTYPSIEKDFKELLLKKCPLNTSDLNGVKSCYGHFRKNWYHFTCDVLDNNDVLPWVKEMSLVVISKEFNPELYIAIGKLLLQHYAKTGSPINILQGYISITTKGFLETKQDGSILSVNDFDQRNSKLRICIKEIIQMFDMEAILIYTAMLLKKRIVVFCNKLDTLLHVCRSLPAFVWHRQDWDMIYPYSNVTELEVKELKGRRTFVAGFLDPTLEERTDLYDIFVNVQDGEIVINPESKEFFQMGKLHKEIATSLVESAKNEEITDQTIVKNLTAKTKDIIANLKSLADNPSEDETDVKITYDSIKSRNFSAAMQNFLFNLASAENLVQTKTN